MPLVAILFRDAPLPTGDAPALAGASHHDALRDRRFWVMLAVFSAVTFGVAGIIPNLAPLLTFAEVLVAASAAATGESKKIAGVPCKGS